MLLDMQLTVFGRSEVSKIGFKDFLKGVWQRLFPLKDIKTALNIKVAMSPEMLENIEQWYNCYCGNASWVKDKIFSLQLEQAITREFSNVVLSEMTANVTNTSLNKIFQKSIRDLNLHLQKGLATGSMIIKPLGGTSVQCVGANAFIPIEYNSEGRLLKAVFPDFKKLGDKYYTRLEFHDLDPVKGLTITNRAFISTSQSQLGREIPLTDVEEWENLEAKISYPKMLKPAFAYYKNPINNTIDGSHCGMSIFASALPIIQMADVQFGRLDWEFESGERRINVDITALQKDDKGKPILKDKIFRGVDVENLCDDFTPQIRESNYINGLNEYKRNIEFEVGLSYGDISNPAAVEKTAEEIKTTKNRKYNTVKAIQNNLKDCLEDLVYALAFYNSMATQPYEFKCDFKDSILTDEDKERQRDIQDLNLGILKPEEYRAKHYNETIEQARANLPKSVDLVE